MRIYYDTEFLEDGLTIAPISIGMVAESGDELYRIVAEPRTITNAMANPWVRVNVLPHLPIDMGTRRGWRANSGHPDAGAWVTSAEAAAAVRGFVLSYPDPELWAWYGAYDHVMLAQLFGRMIDLPEGFPMHTNDLKQEADRIAQYNELANNLPMLDEGGSRAHNALHDAREVKYRAEYLRSLGVPGGHL